MKKVRRKLVLWIFFLVVMMGFAGAQPHISSAFVLEGEWTLKKYPEGFQQQGMVGCVEENVLYCCHRRGFQNKESGYSAVVTMVDLTTGEETDIALTLPERKVNASIARKYWIRGICVEGNRLFLLIQNGILVYQKGKGNRYEFAKRIDSELPDRLQSRDGKLTVVERVPEEGRFVIRRQHDRTGPLDSVFDAQLPGSFMIQYEPNGFVKMTDSSLFFLASPMLRIEKYSCQGDLQAVVEPHISGWEAMPEAVMKTLSAMPYGSDRAMYTFSQGKKYSFPLEISLLRDSILWLSYHHYDCSENREQILSTLVHYDAKGTVKKVEGPYSHFFMQDSLIGNEAFPLYYARRELCLQVTDRDRLVQVVREAPVEWRGKTGRQYSDSAERYFANGNPEIRVRVARLRTAEPTRTCVVGSLGMRMYDGSEADTTLLRATKAVFVVNNPPQCHSCEGSLLAFLQSVDTADCKIYVVFNNADSYLAKRDQIENVRQHLSVPFIPLFVPTSAKDIFLGTLGVANYPALLLKDMGSDKAVILSNEQIFTEDLTRSALKRDFVRNFTAFLHHGGSAGK